MPYKTNEELPKGVRNSLPKKAQDIYRKAFNNAYKQYKGRGERMAYMVAWAAVKKVYKKENNRWVKNNIL